MLESYQGKGKAQTYVGFFNKSIEGVTDSLAAHGWSWETFAINLERSDSSGKFDIMSRRIVFEGRCAMGMITHFATTWPSLDIERTAMEDSGVGGKKGFLKAKHTIQI